MHAFLNAGAAVAGGGAEFAVVAMVGPEDPEDHEKRMRTVSVDAGPDAVHPHEHRMFAVITFRRSEGELRIIARGSTHPAIGAAKPRPFATFPDGTRAAVQGARPIVAGSQSDGVPTPEQLDAAVWYAVNRLAALEGRAVVDPAAGPRVWTAPQVNELTAQTFLRLPKLKSFDDLTTAYGDSQNRLWAEGVAGLVDGGTTVEVTDRAEGHTPDARNTRWVLVTASDGGAQSKARLRRGADGRVVLQAEQVGTSQTETVMLFMGLREAARLGVALSQVPSADVRQVVTAQRFSPATAATSIRIARDVLGGRMDQLPSLGWENAGTPGASADEVAEKVARFRESGGDVLRLTPSDPRFEIFRQRVQDLLDVEQLGSEVDPGIAAMAQAFGPPWKADPETGLPVDGDFRRGETVAVALAPDGQPLAAVGYRLTLERIELGMAGGQAGMDDALTAAIVDGPLRSSAGLPSSTFTADPLTTAYQQAGARVGTAALDAEWLTSVDVTGDEARTLYQTADAARALKDRPVDLDNFVGDLREFKASGAQLAVLSHADPADRTRVDYVLRAVPSMLANDGSGGPPALGEAEDDPHRTTIAVVERGRVATWMTIDATPDRPIEVVDGAAMRGFEDLAAMNWWLSNHQARLGREARFNDAIFQAIETDTEKGPEEPLDEALFMVNGVHHRAGTEFDGLVEGAGHEPSKSCHSDLVRVPDPPQWGDQGRPPQRDPKKPDRGPER
jgi:hypothetical protein